KGGTCSSAAVAATLSRLAANRDYSMPSGPWDSPDRNCRTNALSELNSSSAGPDSTIRPFHSTQMNSATRRALMMSCVMTVQAPPDDLADLILGLVRVLAQREGGVVVEVHRAEERAVLEQDAELLAHREQLVVRHVRHRLAMHEDVALVGVQKADHVLDAHGL